MIRQLRSSSGATVPLRCVQGAYLLVAARKGDEVASRFDPAEVTRIIGLTPTRTQKAGDSDPADSRVNLASAWAVDVPQRDEFGTDTVLGELLAIIEPYAAGLRHACQVLRLEAGVNVIIELNPLRDADNNLALASPELQFKAETLRRLADLGLWLSCHQTAPSHLGVVDGQLTVE